MRSKPFSFGKAGLLALLILLSANCAKRGLVRQALSPELYKVPDAVTRIDSSKNPVFLVYGDPQTGWRLGEKFLWKRNWLTWKMLLFPVYELYWLGNGVIGSINFLRYQPDYGIDQQRRVRDAVYHYQKRHNVDFIINMGDRTTDGRYPSHWKQYLELNRIEKPLLDEIPYFTVIGNHEMANDSAFGAPNHSTVFGRSDFYTLDFDNLRLIVVNSNILLDQYQHIDSRSQEHLFEKWFISSDPATPAWLEKQLKSKQRFKLLFMHHPLISFGKHYRDWHKQAYGSNLQQKRYALLSLLHKHQIDVVFSGHEHYYEHSLIRFGNSDHALHQIVAAAGGVPLRQPQSEQKIDKALKQFESRGVDVRIIKQQKIQHFCIVKSVNSGLEIGTFRIGPNDDDPVKRVETIAIKP